MKKILILRPSPKAIGGISNYFEVLERYFTLPVSYFIRGARKQPHNHSFFFLILLYLYDILRFIFILLTNRYKVIHINTSLGESGLYRDAAFLWIAKLLNRKVILFFRGLDQHIQERLESDLAPLLQKYYFKADMILTLSKSFAVKLRDFGYKGIVHIETTVVDDELVKNISFIELKETKKKVNLEIKILFLARVEKAKGIYESIDAYKRLKKEFPKVKLIIAGDGSELINVEKYIIDEKIDDVLLTGYITGEDKTELLQQADIFLLASYNEGMPNSLLEAMAFGLPIVATKVGGIPDIINDMENGLLLENTKPESILEKLKVLIENYELCNKIACNNFNVARERFVASKVVKRLEKYYLEFI